MGGRNEKGEQTTCALVGQLKKHQCHQQQQSQQLQINCETKPSLDSDIDEGSGDPSDNVFLQPFRHQVGGHTGLLCWDQRHVCKPFTERESYFYSNMPQQLTEFAPVYCGVVDVSFEQDPVGFVSVASVTPLQDDGTEAPGELQLQPPTSSCANCSIEGGDGELTPLAKQRFRLRNCGTPEVVTVESDVELFKDASSNTHNEQNPWSLECQTNYVAQLHQKRTREKQHKFMLLENLVSKFRYPCIVDVKLGTRQHGDNAPEEKRIAQTDKCKRSTSAKLGIRLIGLQVYDHSSGVYHCVDKYFGREIDATGFRQQLQNFLLDQNGKVRVGVCRAFLKRVEALRKVISRAEGYRFFSGSLLLLYDAACAINEDESPVDVRMIDFEHSTFPGCQSDKPYKGIDDGYLLGLRTLSDTIKDIMNAKE